MFSDFPILPEVASTIASQVDALYFFLVLLSAFFFLLIAALIFFFGIRYRKRSGNEKATPVHGSLGLELLWTIIPFGLSMVIFGWGAVIYFDMNSPPPDATNVYVVGKQWMWKVQHPEGNREINEMHVPVGTPVRVIMTSEDVIHSFYVPAFRIKMDVVPGRYTSTWFEATKPGEYHLFCAEYCGTSHSEMIGKVIAMEPTDYQDWLNRASAETQSMAQAGEQLFNQLGCGTCHADDSSARGPSLYGLYGSQVQLVSGDTVTADEAYVRRAILQPASQVTAGYGPVMPTYEGQVTEEELLRLIAYIKSMAVSARSESSVEREETEE